MRYLKRWWSPPPAREIQSPIVSMAVCIWKKKRSPSSAWAPSVPWRHCHVRWAKLNDGSFIPRLHILEIFCLSLVPIPFLFTDTLLRFKSHNYLIGLRFLNFQTSDSKATKCQRLTEPGILVPIKYKNKDVLFADRILHFVVPILNFIWSAF